MQIGSEHSLFVREWWGERKKSSSMSQVSSPTVFPDLFGQYLELLIYYYPRVCFNIKIDVQFRFTGVYELISGSIGL